MNITEIKELLTGEPTAEQLATLAADERKGVQKLLAAYNKRLEKAAAEKERFTAMLKLERELYAEGCELIAGVDEAGRGPLAGPLVIAAVVLPKDVFISGLNDSKQLSAAKRDMLYNEVMAKALDIEVNIVSVSNIDELNIYSATQQGMAQVLENLHCKPQGIEFFDLVGIGEDINSDVRNDFGRIVGKVDGESEACFGIEHVIGAVCSLRHEVEDHLNVLSKPTIVETHVNLLDFNRVDVIGEMFGLCLHLCAICRCYLSIDVVR